MPVNLLLCEGSSNSPDARVLNKLLAGKCTIRPLGGKYGMGERIKARREALGTRAVFGLLDGDFVEKFTTPRDEPPVWIGSDNTNFGWRWERKEIENYLADPAVVERALDLSATEMTAYAGALVEARDAIACYEAARTALSASRVRFRDLPSKFGRKRGGGKYAFPDDLGEAACRDGLQHTVAEHGETQTVRPDEVLARFDALLPECSAGGLRNEHYRHAFAGKDLLWAMEAALQALGLTGPTVFCEKVLVAISQTTDDIGEWLPEWAALQAAVDVA